MKKGLCLFLLLMYFFMVMPPSLKAEIVAGYLEKVLLYPGNIILNGKLDTGARHSSLHADNLKEFKREGKQWIRFEVTDAAGRKHSLERVIVRKVKIKRHFRLSQRRPVVHLGICLDGIFKVVEVNLVDRSRFKYKILIGRSFLSHGILVDTASKYLLDSKCPERKPK